ncbi:Dof zinc finger protein DOF5.8 [Senna tora]|uniref:Dof zinc finger protein DOF5.8 n=1 Tax=Senna tora TaxID=362788 RepID=A0A834XJQ5_9FABA|nr:Dof zinc finger protein DOF5.8 [Senna tora]
MRTQRGPPLKSRTPKNTASTTVEALEYHILPLRISYHFLLEVEILIVIAVVDGDVTKGAAVGPVAAAGLAELALVREVEAGVWLEWPKRLD